MEQKQRFFIYDRKEMAVLLLLGVMVAAFAFTLGVHLGKKINSPTGAQGLSDSEAIPTVPDKLPNRQELTEQAKGAQQAADESLNQALHDEVARTGIKLDTPRQVQLPERTVTPGGGATTGDPKPPAPSAGSEPRESAPQAPARAQRNAPHAPTSMSAINPAEIPQSAVPEADAVALHRQTPEGKFTLQIGSYPALDEARDQADSLEALGLRPYLRKADVKGRRWYRLYLGGYPTPTAAEKAGTRLTAQHKIDAFIVTKAAATR